MEWLSCRGPHAQEQVRRSLVTATAASSCLASALMGVGANLPIAAAPGMGLNAYFLSVVGERGSGRVRRRLVPPVTPCIKQGFLQPLVELKMGTLTTAEQQAPVHADLLLQLRDIESDVCTGFSRSASRLVPAQVDVRTQLHNAHCMQGNIQAACVCAMQVSYETALGAVFVGATQLIIAALHRASSGQHQQHYCLL